MSINWISLQPKFSWKLIRHFERANSLSARVSANALRDAQKMCQTKVGTVGEISYGLLPKCIKFADIFDMLFLSANLST